MTDARAFPLSASILALLLVACSSTSPTPADDSATADASACIVLAKNFDRTCAADSDCTLVPGGGNACDPCAEAECFGCTLASLNRAGAAAFSTALTAQLQSAKQDQAECLHTSCPTVATFTDGGYGASTCQAGLCTTGYEDHCG